MVEINEMGQYTFGSVLFFFLDLAIAIIFAISEDTLSQ